MRLFWTDGVRGKAGEFLTPFLAIELAMAAGTYFKKFSKTNKILVWKDTRRSGYMIENAIVSWLTAVWYDVIQIWPMPTPAIAFLTENMRCDAWIMISASHNPYYDNGIKFFDTNGDKLNETIEKEIEKLYFSKKFKYETEKNIWKSKRIDDVIWRYIVHIKDSFPKNINWWNRKIVLDTANGAAYRVAPIIFEELWFDVITICNNPNGYNINKNCWALYPNKLSKAVLENEADIGFAFDGDADRLVVVDEKWNIVDGDKLIWALSLFLFEQNKLKNSWVAFTIMSNTALKEFLEKKGIKTFKTKVWDKYVLQSLKENNINFWWEQSGHIIFSDYWKTGDGILSALQTISYVIQTWKPASEALNLFNLYPQEQTSIIVKEKVPLSDIVWFDEKLKEIEKLWYNHIVRYSWTENKLRLLIEWKDKEAAKQLLNDLVEFLENKLN